MGVYNMLMLEEKNKYESSLHRRFILRVLAPPFVALLVIGLIVLWQLGKVLHKQAIDDLKLSATTSADSLNREFSLRETFLKQTGAELFVIKSEYNASQQKLDMNRDACRSFMREKRTFVGAPNGVCEPFLSGFALGGAKLSIVEDIYIKLSEELIRNQNQRINDRLSAFKQFFPEVLAVVVVNQEGQVVSSALSGVFKGSVEPFQADATEAQNHPVRGKRTAAEGFDLVTFAIPIQGGSVLAAYDMQNENFLRRIWLNAPVNKDSSLAVLLDNTGTPAYPAVTDGSGFVQHIEDLRGKSYAEFKIDTIEHTVVGASAGQSGWQAVVASPSAVVQAPLRDAQLVGIVLIGVFMVGFLWVGTFFIQRTLRNIVTLVSGAIIFGAGKLDYKISLDHADGEFLRLADTMNAMAERIAAAERAIDEKNKEFISVATHELRAPLTAVIGHLSIFKEKHDKKMDSTSQMLVDQAYYGTVRLRDLVNDMLNVARLESGRSEFSLSPVAVKDIVEDVMSTMRVVADITKVTVSYKSTHAASVIADSQRLRIIINNFVSNAIKYNRSGGHVIVSHEVRDGQLVTCIEDNGLGIPEEQKSHMFEKFFRVQHEDRKSVTGTGLGMYITKQYIEDMQGRLWFESSHGTGTKFYFSLPLAKVPGTTKIKKLVRHTPK
jgi:signal transduction histidine kinase